MTQTAQNFGDTAQPSAVRLVAYIREHHTPRDPAPVPRKNDKGETRLRTQSLR